MWFLGIKAMLSDRGKLVTSLVGVAFSVVLINVQGGLLLGLIKKASLLADFGQADIWVGHKHMHNVDIGTFIPERWLSRVRSVAGVERADPYIVMFAQAAMPDGRFENVIVVGSETGSLLGNAWSMAEGDARAVHYPEGILVDVSDAPKLGHCKVGDRLEINGNRAMVVGLTRGIVGFTTNPYVFTTLDRARSRFTTGIPAEQCSYFLVKAKPGADIRALCARIRQRVPEVDVYDKHTYSQMCMEFWLTRTGIGISFGLAAFLGLLVGLAVVAQTLYASVTERLKEFATLKAMGAADGCIGRFLVAQALAIAVIGAVLGMGCAWFLGHALSSPRAPVELTTGAALRSIVLIVAVCVAAAWLPYWRIRRLDPAGVLRS